MTITLLRSGYQARGRRGRHLGVFPNEWEAQARVDAERVSLMEPGQVRVGEWLSAWRVLFPGDAAQGTIEHQRYMVLPFAREHGDELVGEFTALRAQAWAVEHPAQVKFLRSAWSKAVVMEVARLNVWRLVELPPRPKGRPKRRPPTLGELEAVLTACECRAVDEPWWAQFRDLIEVAAFTGARIGGLVALDTQDALRPALRPHRLTVTEKGGKTREIVVVGRAHDALVRQVNRRRGYLGQPWFLSRSGKRLTDETIGIAWREVRGSFPGPFHSLKHFAATWLTEQGVDREDIAIQLGHTDSEGRPYITLLRSVYVHPDHEEALARLQGVVERREDER